MIAICIGAERNPTVTHLAKPVQLAVESQVLEDAEHRNQKTEHHHEPNETAPILEGTEGLGCQEEHEDIGNKELKFRARSIRVGGGVEGPLAEGKERQQRERREQRRNNNLLFPSQEETHSPNKKQQSRSRFEDSASPILDSAMCCDGERQEGADREADKLHGLALPAESGTNETSSTQAVP